jgi:hypothetical protein
VTPLPGRRAAADLTPVRALRAFGASSAFAGISLAMPWCVGQVAGDRWVWSQWLFWLPAWSVAVLAAAASIAARRWGAPGRVRVAVLAALGVTAALAAARSAWTEIGWLPWDPGDTAAGAVVVTHWNPQWPGERALEAGASLAPSIGDVAILTSPGSLLRATVRDLWMPEGFSAVDLGAVAIVSRFPVVEARLAATASPAPHASAWLAWFRIALPGGRSLRILAVDLPSQPFLARRSVAESLDAMIDGAALNAAPDIVLGDLNSTPGSEVWRAIARRGLRAAPPWRCVGWLGTYRRPWPLLRIDAMFAGERLDWISWRTVDLGNGKHLAQRGVLVFRDGEPDVPAVSGRPTGR